MRARDESVPSRSEKGSQVIQVSVSFGQLPQMPYDFDFRERRRDALTPVRAVTREYRRTAAQPNRRPIASQHPVAVRRRVRRVAH